MEIVIDYEDLSYLEASEAIVQKAKKCIKKLDNHYGKNRETSNGYIVIVERKNDLEFLEEKPTNFIVSKEILSVDRFKVNNEQWANILININERHDIFVFVKDEWTEVIFENSL